MGYLTLALTLYLYIAGAYMYVQIADILPKTRNEKTSAKILASLFWPILIAVYMKRVG